MDTALCTTGPNAKALAAAVRAATEVSTLPQVALAVMRVANDPDSGARELKEVMESDAALSARVLRCVNSSAYGIRTKITNLQQAIAYLGIQQIRNLAVTASVSDLFSKSEAIGPYRRDGLWRHLIAVGIGARLIALRSSMRQFEDVFLAGLLHDLGIVLEDQHLHKTFVEVIGDLSPEATLIDVERRHFGFDHTLLAERLTKLWGFPETVIAATRYHHDSARCRGQAIDVVRCVEAANVICSLKQMTSVGINVVRFSAPTFAALGLGKDDVLALAEGIERELAASEHLFQL